MQQANTTNRDVFIKAWNESDEESLGGSTARLPINPNNNIAMFRGFPTSIPVDELLEGIKNAQLRKLTSMEILVSFTIPNHAWHLLLLFHLE